MTDEQPTQSDEGQPEAALPSRRANRPITFSHRVEWAGFHMLLGFFRLLGLDASSALAGYFLRLLGPMIRPVSKRAEHNLARIHPDWPAQKIRAVTKDLWENLGRTAGEFAHLEKLRPFGPDARIDIVGEDTLNDIKENERPVIFITGHFANWEAIPAALQATGVHHGFVYRAANNPLTDELIINHRAKVMTHYQIPKGKRGGRALVECLKSGRSLLMLVDQKLNSGVSVPFMGAPAMTAPAAARLSLKYDAPLVPLSLERLHGARFKFTAHAPLNFTPTGNSSEDIYALTVLINQTLERDIRARPGQWLWFHRRWPKERPKED